MIKAQDSSRTLLKGRRSEIRIRGKDISSLKRIQAEMTV